ncbi:hypothetical protein GCM10027275_04190 [Rhabdobacter roseus]|uniref:Phosphatidate cytidylyltransferase/phytol kinase n=1 Tax=Rhabdobacter roseus TaxID=1655419 RepID=A0A840TRE4_9BACT|nr:phosphatidate cytidylyltransferase [Rhabdobacter roseus]MBB5282309.1 phosphatidate cytidylyltransferase/phytol kinase [Rhabdobacter roseus]
MIPDLGAILLLTLCFLTLFGLAEVLYHWLRVPAELTRKIVHLGTGVLTLLFPLWLDSHWSVLVLCVGFLLLLLASLKYRFLPSINAVGRASLGSTLYPVAVYGCYLAYHHAERGLLVFYLPMLILAVCDPLAALVGKRWPWGQYGPARSPKTLTGSGAFFLATFLLTGLLLYLMPFPSELGTSFVLVLAALATGAEAVGLKGTDNLTVPLSVLLTLLFYS